MTRRFWFAPERRRLLLLEQEQIALPIVTIPLPETTVVVSVIPNITSTSKTDDYDVIDNSVDNDIQGFDDMIRRLRKNELTLLRVGWTDSNYFSHNHNNNSTGYPGRYQQQSSNNSSNRNISSGHLIIFERALRMNASVRSVSIGWRLSPNILIRIVTVLQAVPLHQLRHIKIVVVGNNNELCESSRMPDTLLTDLFNRQQKLVSIDLRCVQVSKRRPQPQQKHQVVNTEARPRSKKCKPTKAVGVKLQHLPQQSHFPGSVITHCILQQYHQLSQLKSLSLIDCGVTGDIAIELAQFIHIRGGIMELSLRNNRQLSLMTSTSNVLFGQPPKSGIRMICQAPIMRKLDLSLCDFDGADIVNVADGIASRPYPIGEITLAGNYRMDSIGLHALVQPLCCQKMVVLNVSYCSISASRLVQFLNALERMESCNSLLRRVVLCGAAVSNDATISALQHLLLSDCPIRSIQLHDPQEPKPISLQQLQLIAQAMRSNYEMEELLIDFHRRSTITPIWNDLNFSLQLNQVGRRIVRRTTQHHLPQPFVVSSHTLLSRHLPPSIRNLITYGTSCNDWFYVLERAGKVDNLDVLNWIIRHTVDHFQHHMTN